MKNEREVMSLTIRFTEGVSGETEIGAIGWSAVVGGEKYSHPRKMTYTPKKPRLAAEGDAINTVVEEAIKVLDAHYFSKAFSPELDV